MLAASDYILAMDRANVEAIKRVCPPEHQRRIQLFLDYAPDQPTREVPDPYYGGERGFDGSAGAFDHMMWITMTRDGPSIANLKLDGVLDKTGKIPADGAKLCLGWGAPPCPPAKP